MTTSPKDTGFEAQPYYGICTFGRAPHTRDVSGADVAIVGVDNDELVCDFCAPPLSSVQLESRNAGYRAAQLLHGLLSGRKAPAARSSSGRWAWSAASLPTS